MESVRVFPSLFAVSSKYVRSILQLLGLNRLHAFCGCWELRVALHFEHIPATKDELYVETKTSESVHR